MAGSSGVRSPRSRSCLTSSRNPAAIMAAKRVRQPLMQCGAVGRVEHPAAHRPAAQRADRGALQLRDRPPGGVGRPPARAGCAGCRRAGCARPHGGRSGQAPHAAPASPRVPRARPAVRAARRWPAAGGQDRAAARAGRAWCRRPAAAPARARVPPRIWARASLSETSGRVALRRVADIDQVVGYALRAGCARAWRYRYRGRGTPGQNRR